MQITQIVPDLHPTDGVGNYAQLLSQALHDQGICGDVLAYGETAKTNSNRSPSWRLNANVVLAHWSPYGYSQHGVPIRLVRELGRWRNGLKSRRLIVLFHETFAFGAPWRKSFWLSPFQRFLARRVLTLCDFAVTTTKFYEDRLRSWHPGANVKRVAVFSTVGEPETVLPPAARDNMAVVFGRAGVDDWIYRRMFNELAEVIERYGVRKIIDIGPRLRCVPNRIRQVPVKALGVQSREAISRIMSQARFGVLAYPPSGLAKSTTFAAYAAHGVLPLIMWQRNAKDAQCEDKFELLEQALRSTNPDHWLPAQEQLRHWYSGHSVDTQAALWRSWLAEHQSRQTV